MHAATTSHNVSIVLQSIGTFRDFRMRLGERWESSSGGLVPLRTQKKVVYLLQRKYACKYAYHIIYIHCVRCGRPTFSPEDEGTFTNRHTSAWAAPSTKPRQISPRSRIIPQRHISKTHLVRNLRSKLVL